MKTIVMMPDPNIEGISVYVDVPDHISDACLEDYLNEKLDEFLDSEGFRCFDISSADPFNDIIETLRNEVKDNA